MIATRHPRSPAVPTTAVVAVLAAILLALASDARAGRGPEVLPLPDGWQPEGIAGGPGKQLYVGSIPTGRILRLDARTGKTEIVVPQREGRAAVGIKVDRRRIFVAGGPTGRAFVYDARTGADVADVRLGDAPTFINDVTVTRRAAWFTDSVQQRLYRLDLRRGGRPATSAATLPITGELQYDDDPDTLEANGIAAAKGGRELLVVQSRTGGLFRVDARTGVSERVELRGLADALPDADGILLAGRTLYVVQNRMDRIAVVDLSGDLERGTVRAVLTDDDLRVPTTVARLGGELFAVNARFGTPATPETDYEVVRFDRPRGGPKRGDARRRSMHHDAAASRGRGR